MIKTLKKKVVVTSMIAITILLVVLLGAVNAVNAWSNHQETEALLDYLTTLEVSGNRPEWMRNGGNDGPPPLPEGETRGQVEEPMPPELPAGSMVEPENGGRGRGDAIHHPGFVQQLVQREALFVVFKQYIIPRHLSSSISTNASMRVLSCPASESS